MAKISWKWCFGIDGWNLDEDVSFCWGKWLRKSWKIWGLGTYMVCNAMLSIWLAMNIYFHGAPSAAVVDIYTSRVWTGKRIGGVLQML